MIHNIREGHNSGGESYRSSGFYLANYQGRYSVGEDYISYFENNIQGGDDATALAIASAPEAFTRFIEASICAILALLVYAH